MLVKNENGNGWTSVPYTVKDLIKELQNFNPDAVVELHCVAPTEECNVESKCIMIDRVADSISYAVNHENYDKNNWYSPMYDNKKVVIHSKGLI